MNFESYFIFYEEITSIIYVSMWFKLAKLKTDEEIIFINCCCFDAGFLRFQQDENTSAKYPDLA